MSNDNGLGFGNFVPGFDFLQNLGKGAAASMPGLSGWVAPTMNIEELDKRIQELKAVQFWLEQNARALTATVQALEVQKMTLATLQGMNVAVGDMAGAFASMRTPQSSKAAAPGAGAAAEPDAGKSGKRHASGKPAAAEIPAGLIDPMQWWGALTHQFQQIAAGALQEAGTHQAAFEAARTMADGVMKSAGDMANQMVGQGMAAAPSEAVAQPGRARPQRKARAAAGAKKPAAAKAPGRTRRT